MTDESPEPVRRPSRSELLVGFLRQRLLSVALLLVALVAVALALRSKVSTPRWFVLSVLVFIFVSPIGYLTGKKVKALLFQPVWIYLLDIDATEPDGALYRIPEQQFPEFDVVDGDLDRLAPALYLGKDVDLETREVRGTWRGTLTDRELLSALQKVRECRGQLEDDAKRGFALRSQMWTVIRTAVRKTSLHLVQTFERGSLPDDGSELRGSIDQAIRDSGFDDLGDHIDDLEDLDRLDDFVADDDQDDDLDADPGEDLRDRPDDDRADDPADPHRQNGHPADDHPMLGGGSL